MDIEELLGKYSFHDSLIDGAYFYEGKKELIFYVELLFFAQDGYVKGESEVAFAKIVFKDVESFDGKTGKLSSWTILNVIYEKGVLTWCLEGEGWGDYHEWSFSSSGAEVEVKTRLKKRGSSSESE